MSKEAMTLDKENITTAKEMAKVLKRSGKDELMVVGMLLDVLLKEREEALAKQEQGEPVACIHRNEYNEYRLEPHDNFDIKSIPFNVDVPLFKGSQPAQKPLTDEQIEGIAQMTCIGISPHEDTLNFARVIEAAHGIKENT